MASEELKDKQINELSVEELLAQAEAPVIDETAPEALDLDDTGRFFANYEIKGGPHKVKRVFFYEWYKRWSKDPVGAPRFHREANRFFMSNSVHYFLSYKAFEVVEKIKNLMETGHDKRPVTAKVRNHVEYFFACHGIKRGDFWIRLTVLYQMYKTWCLKNGFKVRFRINPFGNMAKHYFVFKKLKGEVFFRVNVEIVRFLSQELLEKVNSNEKNKKKQTKISNAESRIQPEEPGGTVGD